MEAVAHIPILRKTGSVLLAVGLLDIAVMIYCIVNSISYSSSFNIFAVVAGIFLLRGSLRAASIVRWFAMFMLVGFLALVLAWPFIQPVDLTLTQVRLSPFAAVISAAFMFGVLVLLYWLQRQLGEMPVQSARAAAGRKIRDMRVPAAAGVGLVVVLALFLSLLLGGESAAKAISIAQQQLGPAYRYHVSSLNIAKSNEGTSVTGLVTAWNDKEIRSVPVGWQE
ncbi:MAG: hypothetical protein V4792_07625 [Pseudomonadota bacterium]